MNDVVLNKIQIIRRCLGRINEEYQGNPDNLRHQTKQDSIILNLQRACEAAIDLAMHLVSERKLGIPQNSRDAFELLFQNQIITEKLAIRLKAMVGFRNIVIHDYQAVQLEILQKIIELHLNDFANFIEIVLKLVSKTEV
ncbi:MAG TPA: hypothetical protein DDW65_25495 [Firmicutes bacterium]|jgi:uncharacterized protein YutE (UPF0331/DUF86 family)|nr:hypothetical protein [Bacillota bacterium]